jgi:carbon-monoxide dehydrogenase small subunit
MTPPASSGVREMEIEVVVNGRKYEHTVPTRRLLSDFLRHDLGLTGTHVGCEHGVCGACTVLVDGQLRRSCLTLAVQTDGSEVTTVEGLLGPNGELHPIMESFIEEHGLQCGFCTPGFVIRVAKLLEENPHPTRPEIIQELSGNLCRCTGYEGIIRAVESAAAKNEVGTTQ